MTLKEILQAMYDTTTYVEGYRAGIKLLAQHQGYTRHDLREIILEANPSDDYEVAYDMLIALVENNA